MKIYKRTVKSHSFNEDRFVVANGLFGVIDGATDLSDKPTIRSRSYASMLAGGLKKALESCPTCDLSETLLDLSKVCYQALGDVASCGVSLAQIKGNDVNFLCLGDCDLLIKYKDGKVQKVKQHELEALDKIAIDQMIEAARQNGISILDARKHVNPLLIKHRSLMNKPNGYNVFEPMENPSFVCLCFTVDISLIESIIICTDGFAQSYTTLDILPSFELLFDKDCSLDAVIEQIINRSKSDPKCNKYPRFKKIDDITVVKVDF